MSQLVNYELNDTQKELLKEDGYLTILLLLAEREATLDQLCKYSKLPKIKVSFMLDKLFEQKLIQINYKSVSRNILVTTYNIITNNLYLIPVVKNNEISSANYLMHKLQGDLTRVLSNKSDPIPKISYVSAHLSKQSYDDVYNKMEELLDYITQLEEKDKERNANLKNPSVVFLSLYSP